MGFCAQKIMPMNWEHYAFDHATTMFSFCKCYGSTMFCWGHTGLRVASESLLFIVVARFYISVAIIKVLGTHTNTKTKFWIWCMLFYAGAYISKNSTLHYWPDWAYLWQKSGQTTMKEWFQHDINAIFELSTLENPYIDILFDLIYEY